MRHLVFGVLVIVGLLGLAAAPVGAVTYSIDESVIIQTFGPIPAVRTSGVVVICEPFRNFGTGCTAPADVSDSLRFTPLTATTAVTLASDPDTDGIFESPLADSATLTTTSPISALAENFFGGGWSYTPGAATDPGWNPTPGATQDTFLFAGDPEDVVPEPTTLLLCGTALVALATIAWRRHTK